VTAGRLTVTLVVLIVGALICVMPVFTRPTLQFGVRVPAERTGAPVIREERHAYYWRTLALALCFTATTFLRGPGRGWLTAIIILQVAAGLICFWLARARIIAVKNAEGWFAGLRQTVTTDTSWRTDPVRYPVAWLLPAVAVLLATAVIGIMRYPDLPARLAVRFTLSGKPNRWADKSLWTAFSKVVGQAWATVLEPGLMLIVYRSRPDADGADAADATRRYRRYLGAFTRALMVLVALVNVTLLLTALQTWQVYRPTGPAAALRFLPVLAGAVILVTVPVRMGQGGFRLSGSGSPAGSPAIAGHGAGRPAAAAGRDDDRFWKGGLIYVNRDDPAIMVGSRFGFGWTFNFGNPRARLLYGAIIAAIVALALIRLLAGM
jgi:uncharacterized membrane protein